MESITHHFILEPDRKNIASYSYPLNVLRKGDEIAIDDWAYVIERVIFEIAPNQRVVVFLNDKKKYNVELEDLGGLTIISPRGTIRSIR